MADSGWISLRERAPVEADGEIVLVWHAYQGAMAVRRENCGENRFYSHWRRMPAEGWISARERRPRAEDSDIWKCVLARHEMSGFRVIGWHQLARDREYTHWRHTPEPPDDSGEINRIKEDRR